MKLKYLYNGAYSLHSVTIYNLKQLKYNTIC